MQHNRKNPPTHVQLPTLPTAVILPIPPCTENAPAFAHDIYHYFVKNLQQSSLYRANHMILSAIENTGHTLQIGTALTAKTLCDMGLRAPRQAFPISFVDFVDRAVDQMFFATTTPSCTLKISDYWRILENGHQQ